MKQYKSALLALEQDAKPNSKQNKFAKLSIEATDDVLKELCKRVARMYSLYIKPGWSRDNRGWSDEQKRTNPTHYRQWAEMQSVVNNELKAYVEMRLAEGKPEWMVMAEKHGWRPSY